MMYGQTKIKFTEIFAHFLTLRTLVPNWPLPRHMSS